MSKIDLDYFENIIFLNCLKKDSVYLASCVEYLNKDLFKNKDIGAIVGIIKDFYLERDNIPTMTELKTRINTTELKGNLKDAIKCIKDLDIESNEKELIENTEYFLKQRSFENFLTSAIDKKLNIKEFDLEDAQREAEKIHSINLIDDLGLDYFGDNDKVVEYFLQKDNLISTGYKGLDLAFGGGLFKEGRALYCIGGETNVGKSILLANVVVNVLLQNESVVIYTFEMSAKRYAKRISSILTGIAISQLSERITNYKEFIEDFVRKYTCKLIIKEFPTRSVSAKHIFAYTKTLYRKKNFRAGLLAFDYHGLMNPSIRQQSKHGELQYITQEVRGLTYIFEAPGISVMQLNRGSHKIEKPGLDNISGSWDMASDLDGVVNIYQTDEDREQNILRYSGEKARDGEKNNSGFFDVEYETLRLTEQDRDGPLKAVSRPEIDIDELFEVDNFYNQN